MALKILIPIKSHYMQHTINCIVKMCGKYGKKLHLEL